jgi:hypothetical protein
MPSPLPGIVPDEALDSVAHIIEVALTPVFLLSGIGTLLNVFSTRLSRVSDHAEHVSELLRGENNAAEQIRVEGNFVRLRRRRLPLDGSVLLGGRGGGRYLRRGVRAVSRRVRESAIASWLFATFGQPGVAQYLR